MTMSVSIELGTEIFGEVFYWEKPKIMFLFISRKML